MFKPKAQLTNVRPSKTESPEINTAPTSGMIKVNAPAARLLGVAAGDYLTIVPADDENGKEQLYLTKGHAANDGSNGQPKTSQFGAILSSTSGTGAGTLQFGSQNVWDELKGDANVKKYYSVDENAVEYEGNKYFLLSFAREEVKAARQPKEQTA